MPALKIASAAFSKRSPFYRYHWPPTILRFRGALNPAPYSSAPTSAAALWGLSPPSQSVGQPATAGTLSIATVAVAFGCKSAAPGFTNSAGEAVVALPVTARRVIIAHRVL